MKITIPLLLTIFLLVCSGLSPKSKAINPPPDGGYPGFNTAEGTNALKNVSTGVANSGVGWYSLFSNMDGSYNTALGAGTLLFNVGNQSTFEGIKNTAVGAAALLFNTTGADNTAVGAATLLNNTTGVDNTALGSDALGDNTTGNFNTATGSQALLSNTNGDENTANGTFALSGNTEGDFNTAIGAFALANNTGSQNTAVGADTLFNNTAGGNTAIGALALRLNTTGFQNAALGDSALQTNASGSFNTAIGASALTQSTGDGNTACGNVSLFNNTGNNNTALGNIAGSNLTTGDNNIDIGYNVGGVAGESNTVRIGNGDINATFITGISGVTASGGAQVFVNSSGKLGTSTSSSRFKEDIKPMDEASGVILALKPVRFRYKKDIDPQGLAQFGLIAEDVERLNPDLITRDPEGKPQTVRYEQINAMLLNEFLKEHKAFLEEQHKVKEQQREIDSLKAELREQRNLIQKVNDRLEMMDSAELVTKNP